MDLNNVFGYISYQDLLRSIKLRIWSSGKTQKYVAESLGLDPGNFSKILTGVIDPSARTMLKIVDFVNKLSVEL